jgi:uncharacterized protein involved in type VI secretion and phage assembly
VTARLLGMYGDGLRAGEGRCLSVAIGEVSNNKDPDGLGRVCVRLKSHSDSHVSFWAPVLTPMAADQCGVFFLPNAGDTVIVGFQDGEMRFPIVLGAIWNGKVKPPADNADGKNSVAVIKSRRGHIIRLDEKENGEKIEIIDRNGNSVVIDTAKNTITLSAHDIELSAKGSIRMNAEKIEADAKGDSHLTAKGKLAVAAKDDLTLQGKKVDIN